MTVKKNQYFPQIVLHPGETLAEKLDEMSMGPKEFAVRTGKPEKTIISILKGESSITPDMAVQFESVTKIPANFWMRKQQAYNEYLARVKSEELIKSAISWGKSFPYSEMAKLGWVPKKDKIEEKVKELLSFFRMSKHTAWEQYYLNQELKVAFRISLCHTKNPYSISAWLRQGELQAESLLANTYSDKLLKEALPDFKQIMSDHPEDLFSQLQKRCIETGIKLVYTPCMPKAPISGSTRWINDTPIIQLTGRYRRNDSFWFTFFHEIGHILLHGKKDIFLENIEYTDKEIKKEKEADDFAIKWTFSIE